MSEAYNDIPKLISKPTPKTEAGPAVPKMEGVGKLGKAFGEMMRAPAMLFAEIAKGFWDFFFGGFSKKEEKLIESPKYTKPASDK